MIMLLEYTSIKAKAVTDDRKCTLLANLYTLPPEYIQYGF